MPPQLDSPGVWAASRPSCCLDFPSSQAQLKDFKSRKAIAGQCEYDQLRCIVKVLGLPPKEMLHMGSKSKRRCFII